ncbi:MAG: hypothetical protein L6R39_003780 [Caloplaca ligustica]|nr:MAG: hypothetical protein L6R39_003780 [Caloplaca ligustica]
MSLVIVDSKPQPDLPLTLDRLPIEIQRNIYAHLLKAECVRQPPQQVISQYMITKYHFETAISMANKRIHHIAHAMLYQQNNFIVVTCTSKIFHAIDESGVPLLARNNGIVARFNKHVMRLHLVNPWGLLRESKPKVRAAFILLQNDLPDFVRLVQYPRAVSVYDCNLRINIEKTVAGPPNLQVQRLLLEPLRHLTNFNKSVKLSSEVEASYARDVLKDMTSQI